MAKVNYAQNYFTAGVLTPRMYSRFDIEGYRAGAKTCHNMLTLSQGPITRRKGTEFIKTFNSSYGRVFGFQLTSESAIGEASPVVLTADGNFEVIGANGSVAGENVVSNPSFTNGLKDWDTITSSTDATVMTSQTSLLIKASTTPDAEDGVVQEITIDPSDYDKDFELKITTDVAYSGRFSISPPAIVRIGTTSGGNELYEGSAFYAAQVNVGQNSTIYLSIVAVGGIYEDKVIPGEPTEYATPYVIVNNVEFRKPPISTSELIFTTDWTEDDVRRARAYMPPDGDIMYILTPNKNPKILSFNVETEEWTFDDVNFITKPDSWVDGSWPSCMAFHQGRAWWGGVKKEPNKIWSSISAFMPSHYHRINIGPDADDSVVARLAHRGLVKWIEGGENLFIGTAYDEFAMSASSGLITPDDIEIKRQSSYGSSDVKSMTIGPSMIYVSADGRKVRNSDFDWAKQKWVSKDLTFSAEHLTENSRIVDVAYTKNPESVLWFTLSDGSMISGTFEPFSGTIGWSSHKFNGNVLNADAIQLDGESILYIIVSDGVNIRLERVKDDVFLDSHVKYTNTTAVLDGLDHLEGETVVALLDGAYAGEFTVSNGSITIPKPVTSGVVGVPYESIFEPLDVDGTAPNGSTMPYKVRVNKFLIRLLDSIIPNVNGERPPVRHASTPMNTAESVFSGILDVTNVGYSEGGRYTISEVLPFNVTITGIYTEMEQNQI